MLMIEINCMQAVLTTEKELKDLRAQSADVLRKRDLLLFVGIVWTARFYYFTVVAFHTLRSLLPSLV